MSIKIDIKRKYNQIYINDSKFDELFSSTEKVGNYNTLISNKLPLPDKIYGIELVNLNKLEDLYRNYSWYIDIKTVLFNILISISNVFIPDIYKDNSDLLSKFKLTDYQEIKIDVEELSKNNYLKTINYINFH